MLTNFIVVNILQYIHSSKHHIVHPLFILNLYNVLYVNYTSIKLGGEEVCLRHTHSQILFPNLIRNTVF